jgi:hypothetical protein
MRPPVRGPCRPWAGAPPASAPPAAEALDRVEPAAASWPAAWKAQLDGLRRSGAMASEAAARAAAIFAAWKGRYAGRSDVAGVEAGVEALEDGGCYRAGCFVTLTFKNAGAAARFNDRVVSPDDPSSRWGGPRQQLEPIPQPGGKMKVTWLLLPEPAPARPH